MLTPEDLTLIGEKVGEVLEQNVVPALDEIHERLDSVEGRLGSVEGRLGSVEGRLGSVEGNVAYLKSQMVTKDYLDEKIAELRGDITILVRKENDKVVRLVEVLHEGRQLGVVPAREILSMEPFAKLMSS